MCVLFVHNRGLSSQPSRHMHMHTRRRETDREREREADRQHSVYGILSGRATHRNKETLRKKTKLYRISNRPNWVTCLNCTEETTGKRFSLKNPSKTQSTLNTHQVRGAQSQLNKIPIKQEFFCFYLSSLCICPDGMWSDTRMGEVRRGLKYKEGKREEQ